MLKHKNNHYNCVIAVCSCFATFKDIDKMQEHDKTGHQWTWVKDVIIESEVIESDYKLAYQRRKKCK